MCKATENIKNDIFQEDVKISHILKFDFRLYFVKSICYNV